MSKHYLQVNTYLLTALGSNRDNNVLVLAFTLNWNLDLLAGSSPIVDIFQLRMLFLSLSTLGSDWEHIPNVLFKLEDENDLQSLKKQTRVPAYFFDLIVQRILPIFTLRTNAST